jgi:hypothetical protein
MQKNRQTGNAPLTMLATGLMMCGLAACQVSGGQTLSAHPRPATDPDGNTLVRQFGGRAPRPCPAVRHKPSDAEAAILAQCTMEGPFGTIETLLTDVKVHITGFPAILQEQRGGVYRGG